MAITQEFIGPRNDHPLLEMAMSRADFLAELRAMRPQITTHLLKLLAFEAD